MSEPTPSSIDVVRRRRTNFRIVIGVVIVFMLAWCYSIGRRLTTLVQTGKTLAHGSSRLERVDTVLAPGSRVEFEGATIADLRSTGHLGPAAAHPQIDTVALFQRWPALTAFITRDSARFKAADRQGPTPGLDGAAGFINSPNAGDLYLAEFVAAADTAHVAHDTTMYATVDAPPDTAAPIILRLHRGPAPAATPRGELFIGPPTALYRVY